MPMRQRGFSLVVSLVMLLLMTLLGLVLMRNLIVNQNAAGNLAEKQRAIDAAQTGMDAVQFWLAQPGNVYNGSWNTGVDCSQNQPSASSPTVCSNAAPMPDPLPWDQASQFQAAAMQVQTTGGVGTYAAAVQYHVQYLGSTTVNPPTALYKVTAAGQGGNATAKAVIESVFQVQTLSRDIGGN